MPQEKRKEHKCSHHTAIAKDSRWHKFHFSGKVIMCSVLFGLGLVLIGGLVMAIGMDRDDDPKTNNLEEIQNKAPMSVVGPIIMGIGGFTVTVGIVMCLFETNICRKREPDSRPLMEEQGTSAAANNSEPASIPGTTQRKDKHRYHKKSPSPRKHKGISKKSSPPARAKIESACTSPSSLPIDVQRNSSRDVSDMDTNSQKYCSFSPEPSVNILSNYSNAENLTSASLLKSFTSSGTSTEFKTPPSSLQDSSGSFEARKEDVEVSANLPNLKEPVKNKLERLKHEFLTPKNSNTQILDHEFITPKNSFVENVQFIQNIEQNSLGSADTKSVLQACESKDTSEVNSVQAKSVTNINQSRDSKEDMSVINLNKNVNTKTVQNFPSSKESELITDSELNSEDTINDNLSDENSTVLNYSLISNEVSSNGHVQQTINQEGEIKNHDEENSSLPSENQIVVQVELHNSALDDASITSLQSKETSNEK